MNNAFHGGVATTLMATPFWSTLLHDVSATLSFISVLCGSIIGVTTLYRMYRKKHNHES